MLIIDQISAEELINRTADKVLERIKNVIPQPKSEDELLTCKQAAELLQVSLPTLHEYSKSGIIPSYRLGRNVRYKKLELEDIINQGLRFKSKVKSQ